MAYSSNSFRKDCNENKNSFFVGFWLIRLLLSCLLACMPLLSRRGFASRLAGSLFRRVPHPRRLALRFVLPPILLLRKGLAPPSLPCPATQEFAVCLHCVALDVCPTTFLGGYSINPCPHCGPGAFCYHLAPESDSPPLHTIPPKPSRKHNFEEGTYYVLRYAEGLG